MELVVLQGVLSVLYLLAMGLVSVAVLVGAVVHREAVRRWWKPAAALSGLVLLLHLPLQVISVAFLDWTALFESLDLPEPLLDRVRPTALVLAVVASALSALVALLWRVLLVPVAEVALPERPALPTLRRARGEALPTPTGWAPGAAAGLACGLVSAALFLALDVQPSQLLQQQAELYTVDLESPLVILGAVLPMSVAAAISEELAIRGVVQRWLVRWLGGGTAAVVVAVVLASALWTVAHAANTDQILLKFAQIFALGLVFGGLAHRWSVEAAIVAHVLLNVVVVLAALAAG